MSIREIREGHNPFDWYEKIKMEEKRKIKEEEHKRGRKNKKRERRKLGLIDSIPMTIFKTTMTILVFLFVVYSLGIGVALFFGMFWVLMKIYDS